MWRAIRIADGKVLFEDRNRTRVEGWVRRMNAGFLARIDRVPSATHSTLRYFG